MRCPNRAAHFAVSLNFLWRGSAKAFSYEEKVSPLRTLVTDVVEHVTNSPEAEYKSNISPHTTSGKNRFRRADFCQLLLKEKPFSR